MARWLRVPLHIFGASYSHLRADVTRIVDGQRFESRIQFRIKADIPDDVQLLAIR
jgi:hypothetical protein